MSNISRRKILKGFVLAAIPMVTGVKAQGLKNSSARAFVTNYKIVEKIPECLQSLPFESQQIGGIFADRMRTNVESRLLRVDEVALLKGYVYPRANVSGFAGEHTGMFLDAASNVLEYSNDARMKALADRMATTLLSAQESDGYLGACTPSHRLKGVDVWVLKWNLTGLLSYYEFTRDVKYLATCQKIGDLLCRTFGDGPGQIDLPHDGDSAMDGDAGGAPRPARRDDGHQSFIGQHNSAILEPMCRLYRLTGEPRYLEFSQYVIRFYAHQHGSDIVQSMLKQGSVTATGSGHVYSMLSNFNGILDLYRLTGEQELLIAVMRAWEDIRGNQRYITGATGSSEFFSVDKQLPSLFSSNVGECCATVTWLQLNWRLFRLTGEARFGQEIERAVYNHLLAAQHPHNGDIAYFTSLTGHKEFRSSMVCCLSNGPRGISLIPQWIWGVTEDAFVVNLYTAGVASFAMNDVQVKIESQTEFPLDGNVILKIDTDRPVPFAVRLRVPEWAEDFEVKTGTRTLHGVAGQMLDVTQMWSRHSTLRIRMKMTVSALPGGSSYPDYVALRRGPQILALERRLNPEVPYLERTALAQHSQEVSVTPISAPIDWPGRQVYEVDGVALRLDAAGILAPKRGRLRFVPFADAVEYRVWTMKSAELPQEAPAVTAFARGWASTQGIRVNAYNSTEALTDENPQSFCTVDPTVISSIASMVEGARGKKDDPVWFAVMLEQPETITRVAFRHGASTAEGGWFDTSGGKPRIQVTRVPRGTTPWMSRDPLPLKDSDWITVATLEDYPAVNPASSPSATDRQVFEISLPTQIHVYGIRIVGRSARDYVTCAELSASA